MANPTNPGASNTTPDNPAAPGGSEGTGNPPSAANPQRASGAVMTFKSTVDTALGALEPWFLVLPPKESPRTARVSANDRQVIATAIAMLRDDPTLSGINVDDFQAMVDDADACAALSRDLGTVIKQVDNTGRLRLVAANTTASELVAVARKRGPSDPTLTKDLASINALRARGPKAAAVARLALADQEKAAKAEARSTKAAQKATATTARANALQHGTGDAIITQPAPAAPAPSTTDAAAPASTPGTPGSTTIR